MFKLYVQLYDILVSQLFIPNSIVDTEMQAYLGSFELPPGKSTTQTRQMRFPHGN